MDQLAKYLLPSAAKQPEAPAEAKTNSDLKSGPRTWTLIDQLIKYLLPSSAKQPESLAEAEL